MSVQHWVALFLVVFLWCITVYRESKGRGMGGMFVFSALVTLIFVGAL